MPTSDRDTIVFADHDGLFPAVSIDGFFDRDFMITNEPVETGYVGGSMVTLGAAGIAPAVFQGVRSENDRLVMAFLCRFSHGTSTEAENDELFIALKSSFGSNNVNDVRLIRVNPRASGGALGGAGVNSSDGVANDIRANRDGRVEEIFKPDGAGGWTDISPTNVDIKVRTWKPEPVMSPNNVGWSIEVSVPRVKLGPDGGGSDWIDIDNHFGFAFCIDLIIPVGGGAVSQYLFPLNAPVFDGFSPAIALSKITFGHGLIPGVATPPLTETAKGVYFMGGWQGIGHRAYNPGSPNAPATPGALGDAIAATGNQIVALLGNDGATNAAQVQIDFAMAHWGLPSGNPNFWTRPDGLLPVKIPMAGQAVNAGATNVVFGSDPSWDLDAVTPNYKGSGMTQKAFFKAHDHQCMWAQASAIVGGVNFRQSSVRRNMNFVIMSDVERDAVVSGEGYEEPANGKAEHDFILETFCRHIPVQSVIENIKNTEDETKYVIAGALEQKRSSQGDEPVVGAVTHVDAMNRGGQRQYKDDLVVIWITLGYRMTKNTVLAGGKRYPLLDNGSGSFGFVAYHQGVKDNFSWALEGPGLGTFGPGVYGLKVPHKGEATIKTRIACNPDGPVGDNSRDLPKLDPKEWVPPVKQGDPDSDPKPPKPDDGKNGFCGLIALGIIGVPLVWAASQLVA